MAILVDPNSLPFDLGPSKFENSPSKFENSASKFENSSSKFENSPSKFENSPSNYDNRVGGGRTIVTEDGKALGYYTFGEGGIINFYNYNSIRVAFLPGGGHTQSVFSDEDWCGTLGQSDGQLALGLSQSCFYAFLMRN